MTNEMYAECRQVLEAADAALTTAECHGLLCGALCAGGEVDPRWWLHEVLGDAPDSSRPMRDCRAVLLRIMQQTISALGEPDFGFSPLLPDDDEPLATRTRALGQWCSGFLCGLGLGGVSQEGGLSPDAQEVLSDLAEFARIADEVEASREGEADYAHLVEYVRVGVMVIHEEAVKRASLDSDPPARH